MTTQVQERPAGALPTPGSARRLDIQGLRAVAVLLVVAFHAGLPVSGGFVGVDVFFVISGFVITAMLMREWARYGRLRFGHFYFRRFLRLTPALALLVASVALASIVLENPFGAQQTTARTGIGAMLLSANYVIAHASGDYFAADAVTNPLLHTWSLSVEEQFYLVFPALLALGWVLVRRGRRRAALGFVLLIAVGSFLLSLAWSYGATGGSTLTDFFGGPESFAFYSSVTRAWEFAIGALLALGLTRLPHLSTAVASAVGWVGAGALTLAALAITETQPFPGVAALLPVGATALLIWAGSGQRVGVSRLLSARPMVHVGDLSYSWYLWHWPIIVFTALVLPNRPLALVVAAVVSFLPALLSYRWLEQPLRRYRPRTPVRAAALVTTTVAVPLVVCAGLLVGAGAGWGLTPPGPSVTAATGAPSASTGDAPGGGTVEDPSATGDGAAIDSGVADGEVAGGEGGSLRSQHALVRAGCVNTDLDPDRCRFGPASARGTVLLAGDSQAYALADGVIAAAESLGLGTVATSHTGCPFLARESSGVHNYPCRSWQRSIVEWALAARPAAVVIANRSGGYVNPQLGWRTAARDDGRRAESIDEAADLWRQGLTPVVRTLSDAGIPVVIMAAVPEMRGYTDRTSLLSQAFGAQPFEVNRQDAEDERRPALDVEEDLATAFPGVRVFDPLPLLCDDDTCSTQRDGEPVYQDETHLSVQGSLLLTDAMASALDEATRQPGSP